MIDLTAKIFSLIIRNRINSWAESNSIFNENQFGFRDGKSTADCVFLLHSIIQNVITKNKSLYVAFIDYEKAFDTVKHDILFNRLIDCGISLKILNIIKSLYKKVLATVKLHGEFSDLLKLPWG